MTNSDRPTWITTTAALVTTELPLQSLSAASDLVVEYLSNVGGWVADNILIPLGPGQPANHFTEQQAADAIVTEQFGTVYDLNFHATATIVCQFATQLGPGLTLEEAAAAMAAEVTNLITNSINNSNIPIRVNSIDSQNVVTLNSELSGTTDSAHRQLIQADLTGVAKIIDYKEIALQYARTINGIDATWNIKSVYTESNSPIVMTIVKYTDITYVTLDTSSHVAYVYSVSQDTNEVVSGVIIDI
jgi:hypothetical protein